MPFTVYPAIDMRRGRCVRLRQGRADAETIYFERPAEVALQWQGQGAHWLHIVNLDGALDSAETWSGPNVEALRAILAAVSVPVQFGGGVRTVASVGRLLDLGVARVILGTIAVSEPEVVARALERHGPEQVMVSLDARDGLVATHGWVTSSALPTEEVGERMRALGVRYAVHTDIGRDGMLTGANVAASVALAEQTGLQVIVSGGVATLDDIAASARHAHRGLAGVIVGQALYTDAFTLSEAVQLAAATEPEHSAEGCAGSRDGEGPLE